MVVVSESLEREIEIKKRKVESNPHYYLRRSNKIVASLRNMSNIFSFWLENPELRMQILRHEQIHDCSELKKLSKKGVLDIASAWDYLKSTSHKEKLQGNLSPEVILEVGKRILPTTNSGGFREARVSMCLDNYCPPNYVKVPELVYELCEDINKGDLSPLESAITAHLRITGIQPFLNGNKRTGRLIQDAILSEGGLPPAVIPCGERIVYIDLLEQALVGWREVRTGPQKNFYNYVAGKVNSALDSIIRDIL